MTKLLLAAAIVFSACADEVTDFSDGGLPIELEEEALIGLSNGPDDCSLVVETEGPCAVACDPEAVMEHIPPDSCVIFVCELETGVPLNIGGCRPAEARPAELMDVQVETELATD